ncbi:MAG TPA: hypothetical protein HPP77_04820 [Candidatus Hydrogenedentes bacterium]|nr:hypothetical protein [Candidatus Hydrogenedentota bacterium]
MLCQKCHKNRATVRYAEVIDGKVTDLHLCRTCLEEREHETAAGFELSGPAPTFRHHGAVDLLTDLPAEKRICPACKTKFVEVVATGQLGCGTCYDTFADRLAPLLLGFHVSARHRGKAPQHDDALKRIRAELRTKRALLQSSLSMENYEDAAVLRDEIRLLEAGLRTRQRDKAGTVESS